MITVFCPQCNKRYEVPDELVGMELACPNCSTRFTVQEDNGDLASPPLQPMDMSPYEDDNDELEGDTSEKITCPHCWNEFKLSQVNYISNHPTLIGDSVLGEAAQTRFLPNKFNAQGYAIDAKGMICRDMACPRCHLKIPEILLEEKVDVISIVGAPASGKSYFITSMTSMVRRNLPEYFDYSFSDADVSMNYMLNQYEDMLFHNATDAEVALPKTELEGANFASQVKLNGFTVNLPLPYIFTLRRIHESNVGKGFMHNIVMYDNAGEHFEAGRDSVTNLATMHLINSSLIMFMFDPFKDSKVVKDCNQNDPQANVARRSINQMQILREMINRIKKFRGMIANEKSDKMFIVLVPKYDAWKQSFPFDLTELSFTTIDNNYNYNLNLSIIQLVSFSTRQWLLARVPELVFESEAFFDTTYFLPVSALGTCPNFDSERNMIGINPQDINPVWVDVPIYIYLWQCGLVPAVESGFDVEAVDVEGFFKNDNFCYMDAKTGRLQTVPALYWGKCVYDMNLGKYRRFPERPHDAVEETKASPTEDSFWN